MFGDLSNLLGAIGAGRAPTIARSKVKMPKDYVVVSTVNTTDCGPETAIIDSKGTYPVERYDTEEEAKKGHKKWVFDIAKLKRVTQLGYGDSIDEETITLSPMTVEKAQRIKEHTA